MQHEKKNFVYLQRLNHTNSVTMTVRNAKRFGHFLCLQRMHIYSGVKTPWPASNRLADRVCRFKQREVAHRFSCAAMLKLQTL